MKFNMRINPSRKNRVLALITLAGLATTGTLMATAPEHDAADIEEKAWPVTTMTLEARALSPELRLFGRVETPRHAQLTAAVTATVDTLSISEGELVEAGQVLMTLDDADEELRLLQRIADTTEAQAKLDSTRREFAVDTQVLQHMQELHELTLSKRRRLDTLQQQNLVAAEQLEDTRALVARQAIQLAQQQLRVDNHPQRLTIAEAAVERSRALMQEQELRLSRTVIVAPFRGRISHIDAAPGDRVREGEILLAMYDTDALQVRVTLPRNAIASIKQALAADDTISAQLHDSPMTLRLHQLAAEVSTGRSGVDGLFKVIGNGDTLELGKAVNITVVMPPLADVATVPIQSLYGDNRIYAIFEGRLQGVEVDTLGQRTDDQGRVELLIRPQQGELPAEILTTSLPRASTGLRVNVING
jgi:multidrug efflux pump subunit AcrA (membrane-fusion protein)